MLSLRVTGLVIKGNRFERGFTESIDLRAGDGDVAQNYLAGTAGTCDICLAGPGNFRAVGNRVDALGVGAPNVRNRVEAIIRDNVLVNNRFGVIVHAAFPVANTVRKGDVAVTLSGNVFEQNCQARLLVSLSRHTTALGLATQPYLLNSTFELDLGGNIDWEDVWYSHAAGFGNSLVVDGIEIANGSRHFYEAAGCPSK